MERLQIGDDLLRRRAGFKTASFLRRKSCEETGLCIIEKLVQFGRHPDSAKWLTDLYEACLIDIGCDCGIGSASFVAALASSLRPAQLRLAALFLDNHMQRATFSTARPSRKPYSAPT
jgi:hypothetical protein